MMLQGMTVRYLFKQTYPANQGHRLAASCGGGGIGLIACQWAYHIGGDCDWHRRLRGKGSA